MLIRMRDYRYSTRITSIKGLAIWTLAALLVSALPVQACEVPVYEWGLFNWAPDDYDLYIFHESDLTEEQQTFVERFPPDEASGGFQKRPDTNVRLHMADVKGTMGPLAEAVWKDQGAADTPWAVLRFPNSPPARPDIWAGVPSPDNLEAIVSSPVRGALAQALSDGNSFVWLMADSGHDDKDNAAMARLEAALAKAATEISPDAIAPTAKISYDVLRVARDDPAERFLVNLLMLTEPDLLDYDEPMAFPIFGRGRALYALIGNGIVYDTIEEACIYMSGRCSCIVKDDNPGTDLLLAADWETVAAARMDLIEEMEPETPLDQEESAGIEEETELDENGPPWILGITILAIALLALTGATYILSVKASKG